jgi:hypothetical protein
MKQLYIIFTKQRKALELSIKKNKKYEMEQDLSNKTIEELQNSSTRFSSKLSEMEQMLQMS